MAFWTPILLGFFVAVADDPDATRVVATVDGRPITAAMVQWRVNSVLRGRDADPDALRRLRAQALEDWISRTVIMDYLEREKLAATKDSAAKAFASEVRQWEARGRSFLQRLADQGGSEALWRREYRWRASWPRGLKQFVTDANLQRYFNDHRRDFDGTTLRVAHILLQVDLADTAAVEAGRKKADSIRSEIQGGKLAFQEAAARYSQSPSANQGGDIGWIARREPMTVNFSDAAFRLKNVGDISPPTVSPHGVHLIQLLEVKPGSRSWTECRSDLNRAVSRYVFEWLDERERKKHVIVRK